MKRLFLALMLALPAAFIQAGEAQISFENDPGLKVESVPGETPQLIQLRTAVPVPETRGGDFAAEIAFSIEKFQHYGVVQLALTDAEEKARVECRFSMGDDRVQRGVFSAQSAPGMTAELPVFQKAEPGAYRLQITYDSTRRLLNLALRNAEGEKVYTAENIAFRKRANFSKLILTVTSDQDQNGEISYLPDRQAVYFLSYVGNEGNYAYMIEGTLNSIKMRTRE